MDTSAPVTETPYAVEAVLSGLSKSGAESVAKSMKSTAQSVKSTAQSIKSNKSVKSTAQSTAQSVKSTAQSVKSVKSTTSKLSSIAPANLEEAASEPKDVLVTVGTFDSGFEVNF